MAVLTIPSITLDGSPLPLGQVAADVTIRHGRSSYFDGATASTCQITALGVSRSLVQSVKLGAALVVNYSADGGPPAPRFTGRTTDATLDGDALTIIGVGKISTLDGFTVGASGAAYPQETWSSRVGRVFQDAGLITILDLATDPALNPVLNSRAAGNPLSLAEYVDGLLGMVGAAMADMPNGHIRIEAVTGRSSTAYLISVPADTVLYAPRWENVLPGFNTANVPYGGPGTTTGTATATDTAAVTKYGPRPTTVDPSEIRNLADAQTLANNIVARQAAPRWSTPSAELLTGLVLAPSAYEDGLMLGRPLKITNLPSSAPFNPWTGIVEGWTDRVSSDGDRLTWGMEISLSDPFYSGVTVDLAWEDVAAAVTWASVDPTITWDNANQIGGSRALDTEPRSTVPR